jgi:hypothetical protein
MKEYALIYECDEEIQKETSVDGVDPSRDPVPARRIIISLRGLSPPKEASISLHP